MNVVYIYICCFDIVSIYELMLKQADLLPSTYCIVSSLFFFRPYKLTPATALALQKLKVMTVTQQLITGLNLQECSICQEELEVGNVIAEMPGCNHCFHNDCVLKWFDLVSVLPSTLVNYFMK